LSARGLVVVAVVAGSVCLPTSARAGQPIDIQVVSGTCDPSSHTAEGALGADLTKRQSRFYCNSAAITFFDDYKGHVMVQFAQKEAHHTPILGFAGKVQDDGVMMVVDHVYLGQGNSPTTVSEGWCKFFFKNRHMSGIFCGIKVDETGRRTTAVVAFNAAGQ
jgi:hypothetical protein